MLLIQWALFLAPIGYLSAALSLLARLRRAAAVGLGISAVAWWCLVGHEWVQAYRPLHPVTYMVLGGLFVIGLIHALFARWFWQHDSVQSSS